jgi:hypothetical protein
MISLLDHLDLHHFHPGDLQHLLMGMSYLALSASRDAEANVDRSKYGGPQL